MNKRTEDFVKMLGVFMGNLHHPMPLGIAVDEGVDEGVDDVSLRELGIGVYVGSPVTVRSINGDRNEPGYHVYYVKVYPGNRWNPPEEDPVPTLETTSVQAALIEVGRLLAIPAAENAVQSLNPEY